MANIQATISPRKNIVVTNFNRGSGGATIRQSGLQVSSTLPNQTLDTFSILQIRAAKYSIQATYNNDVHVTDLTVTHDGTEVYVAAYGEIVTNIDLFSIDADIDTNTSEVRLLVSPVFDTVVLKFSRYEVLL